MRSVPGIYLITCRPPGKLPLYYVGQSINVSRRCSQHRYALRAGRHFNPKLQRFWTRYGEGAFEFQLLEVVHIGELDAAELWWLQQMVGSARCFNSGTDPVAPFRGRKFSDAHKEKIAAALKGERHYHFGRPLKQEHRKNISAGGRGVMRSAETKARISAATTGQRNAMFGKSGALNARSKPVERVCIRTGAVLRYESATLAEGDGFDQGAISRACAGKQGAHKGYRWRFVTQETVAQLPKMPFRLADALLR